MQNLVKFPKNSKLPKNSKKQPLPQKYEKSNVSWARCQIFSEKISREISTRKTVLRPHTLDILQKSKNDLFLCKGHLTCPWPNSEKKHGPETPRRDTLWPGKWALSKFCFFWYAFGVPLWLWNLGCNWSKRPKNKNWKNWACTCRRRRKRRRSSRRLKLRFLPCPGAGGCCWLFRRLGKKCGRSSRTADRLLLRKCRCRLAGGSRRFFGRFFGKLSKNDFGIFRRFLRKKFYFFRIDFFEIFLYYKSILILVFFRIILNEIFQNFLGEILWKIPRLNFGIFFCIFRFFC